MTAAKVTRPGRPIPVSRSLCCSILSLYLVRPLSFLSHLSALPHCSLLPPYWRRRLPPPNLSAACLVLPLLILIPSECPRTLFAGNSSPCIKTDADKGHDYYRSFPAPVPGHVLP